MYPKLLIFLGYPVSFLLLLDVVEDVPRVILEEKKKEREKEKKMGKIFEEDQQVLIFQYNPKNQFSSFSTHFSVPRLSYFQLESQKKQNKKERKKKKKKKKKMERDFVLGGKRWREQWHKLRQPPLDVCEKR